MVLIDKWWNVNKAAVPNAHEPNGFNRYMMECKFIIPISVTSVAFGFNRYMVECKYNKNS